MSTHDGQLMAEQALSTGWRLDGRLTADTLGVNNQTWMVDSGQARYWLRRCTIDEQAWRVRELALLEQIAQSGRIREFALAVPEVLSTVAGSHHFISDGFVWSVTRHIPGDMPDPSDLAVYPHLAQGMARLHALLATIAIDFTVAPSCIVDDLEYNIRTHDSQSDEPILVARSVEIVRTQLPSLRKAPAALIHGDFSHPNLRINRRSLELTGVLDFEFCSRDPAILDIATLLQTILVRSRASNPRETIAATIRGYGDGAVGDVSRDLLRASVIARKLDSYWYHRNGLREGRGERAVVERQLVQLQFIFDALDGGMI